jgi:hypothetical protein
VDGAGRVAEREVGIFQLDYGFIHAVYPYIDF